MSDPVRTGVARTSRGLPPADKEARIEELLLLGLDEYFAGQYEQAINIWTRVIFLERGNSRARAYIERARGALAERHRESEELLHRGIAAFNSGQTDAARDLLTRAVQQGAPHDVALVLLERLNRLSTPPVRSHPPVAPTSERESPSISRSASIASRSLSMRVLAVAVLVAAGVAIAVSSDLPLPAWLAHPTGQPQEHVAAIAPDPLPVARPADRLMDRARALQSHGRLLDALRTLDGIDVADPIRDEADRLKGELQRQLLDATSAEAAR